MGAGSEGLPALGQALHGQRENTPAGEAGQVGYSVPWVLACSRKPAEVVR